MTASAETLTAGSTATRSRPIGGSTIARLRRWRQASSPQRKQTPAAGPVLGRWMPHPATIAFLRSLWVQPPIKIDIRPTLCVPRRRTRERQLRGSARSRQSGEEDRGYADAGAPRRTNPSPREGRSPIVLKKQSGRYSAPTPSIKKERARQRPNCGAMRRKRKGSSPVRAETRAAPGAPRLEPGPSASEGHAVIHDWRD
jgi:hypothetical protein